MSTAQEVAWCIAHVRRHGAYPLLGMTTWAFEKHIVPGARRGAVIQDHERSQKRKERDMAKKAVAVMEEDAADVLAREEAAEAAAAQAQQAEKDQRQRRAYVERATHYVNEHAKLMESVAAIRTVPSLRPLIEAFSVSNGALGDAARSEAPPFIGRLEMWTSLVIQLREDMAAQSGRLQRHIKALEDPATSREKVMEILPQLDRQRLDQMLEEVMGKIRNVHEQRRKVAAEMEQVIGLFAPLVAWTEAE